MTQPGVLSETLVLKPLRRVSPSRFFSLTECALREILSASHQAPLLPSSPAARLGSAIHRLLEAAGKGALREINLTAIERVWGELVEQTEQGMRQSWLERSLVPLSRAIPHYEVRKIRACHKAEEVARAVGVVPHARSTSAPGPDRFESWIETSDGLVGGSIDEIQETTAGTILRDYKSGHIIERQADGSASDIDEKYKLQLKLYAALFGAKYGRWPTKLEVVPLQGSEKEISFTPVECDRLLSAAIATLKELNDRINQALRLSDHEQAIASFANPTPDHCRNCCFRPSCKSYQAAHDFSQSDDWPRDVWGTVSEFKILGNKRLTLAVRMASPRAGSIRVRGLTGTNDRHPALKYIREGEQVAIYNLKGKVELGELRETMSTVIYLEPKKLA